MSKNNIKYGVVIIGCMLVLGGCQKSPEVITDNEIPHAQSSLENEIQGIVDMESEAKWGTSGEYYEGIIGTEGNGIRINASIPRLPEKVYQFSQSQSTLLQKEDLIALIGSQSDSVKDITEDYLEEIKAFNNSHSKDDFEFSSSSLGDGTVIKLIDNEKETLLNGTSVQYVDITRNARCQNIYKTAKETFISLENKDIEEFSASSAKQMLMEKLQTIGITEINLYETICYESDDLLFYEINFTPSYHGIGIAHEFGQVVSEEVFPTGRAWIAEDGVASFYLDSFCGEITRKREIEKLLDFAQLETVLNKYLEGNTLQASTQVEMSQIAFEYYPIYKETELECIPVWHIYIPVSQWMEAEYANVIIQGAAWNIYVNAVTGELEKVE